VFTTNAHRDSTPRTTDTAVNQRHNLYIYSLALFRALLRIGSILVAFMTSPLTLSFPLMNSFCAFALPEVSFAKSTSLMIKVTASNALAMAAQN